MHELPFPVQLGGSRVSDGRVTGQPSLLLPLLRDLHDANHPDELTPHNNLTITLEVDTRHHRYVGTLEAMSSSNGANTAERVYLRYGMGGRHREAIRTQDIVALRVRKIEVEELPYERAS